jgi:mannose-6-phosphate isomerase-like protein (cupin superfamily)
MIEVAKHLDAKKIMELDVSEFTEYPLSFENVSVGVSEIHGRYPATGFEVDTKIEQVWYVEAGEGVIITETKEYSVEARDMIRIPAKQKYAIQTNHLRLVVTSTPPWTKEQHQHIA